MQPGRSGRPCARPSATMHRAARSFSETLTVRWQPMDSDTRKMTGAEAMIRCMGAECGTDVFGLPGGAILPLYDAWAACDHPTRHYLVRHAQRAGPMAQGYERATGRL